MFPRKSLRSPRFWLLLTLTAGGVALFVWQQDFTEVQRAFSGASPLLVVAAVGAYFLSHGVRAMRWRLLLSHLKDCGHWPPLHALTIGVMANNLLPAKAGLVARTHLLSKHAKISHTAVGSSLVVEALLDGLVLTVLAALALTLADMDGAIRLMATVFAGSMAVIYLFIALLLRGSGLSGRPASLLRRCPLRLQETLLDLGRHIVRGVGALRQPRLVGGVIGTSGVSWALMGTAFFLLGQAFHLTLSPTQYIVLLAVVHLAVAIPSAAGGIGTFELATAQALLALGAAPGAAGAYVVALHALLIVPISLAGLSLLWINGERLSIGRGLPAGAPLKPFRLVVRPKLLLVGRHDSQPEPVTVDSGERAA